MPPTIPTQQRALDPYSEKRFSSSTNRLTRSITGGNNVILFPEESFDLAIVDYHTFTISPGICIKDDVLIHITEEYTVDLTDSDFFIDGTAMDSIGEYYIVLQYAYARSLPAPAAYFRIIKNIATYYTQFESSYIYLGSIQVIHTSKYEISTIDKGMNTIDGDINGSTETRPSGPKDWYIIDGGELEEEEPL